VVVICQVSSKEEAAKVIEQFRTFKSVMLISTDAFVEASPEDITVEAVDDEGNRLDVETEETDEEQKNQVSFTLTLTYTDWASRNATPEADVATGDTKTE
jgi:hypothetical protein